MKKIIYSGKSEGFYIRRKVKELMDRMNFSHIVEEKKGYISIDGYMINRELRLMCNFYGNRTVIEANGKEEEISKIEEIIRNEEKS